MVSLNGKEYPAPIGALWIKYWFWRHSWHQYVHWTLLCKQFQNP